MLKLSLNADVISLFATCKCRNIQNIDENY